MRQRNGVWSSFLASGLVAGLAACGGGSSGNPVVASAPAPTPTPCTQTTVEEDAEGIAARTLIYFDFSVPDSGRLDVSLDWTLSTSSFGFYLVPANTCSLAELNSRSCNFLVRSEPSSTKPKKISTPNFNAGNYRWIVGNYADVQESFSLRIVLSKGDCPALTGGPPAASSQASESLPPLERMIPR